MKKYFQIQWMLLLGWMFLLSQNNLTAQQLPLMSTQSAQNFNPSIINADYFKNYAPTDISLRYRYQWTDLKDAPQSLIAHFSHWNEDYSLLFGGSLISDQTGPTGFTGLYGKIGYGINLSDDLLLSVALRGGAVQYRVKGNDLVFLEPDDVATEFDAKFFPDFSIGATLYFNEQYYVGISVPQVLGVDLTFNKNNNDFNIQRVQHYHGIVGTFFNFYDESRLDLSSEVRYLQNIPLHFMGRIKYEYQQLFWVGLAVANSSEVSADIGLLLNVGREDRLLRIGYAFSNYFQRYGPAFGNAHELGFTMSW